MAEKSVRSQRKFIAACTISQVILRAAYNRPTSPLSVARYRIAISQEAHRGINAAFGWWRRTTLRLFVGG